MYSSRTELAWAAGFFDGEGSTSVGGRNRAYPHIKISQVERQPLERFIAAIGEPKLNITGPYKSNPTLHHVGTSGTPVKKIMAKLWPYLSDPKKAQWERVKERLCIQ